MRLKGPGLLLFAGVVGAAQAAAQNPPAPPAPRDSARTPRLTGPQGDTLPLPDSLSPERFRPELPLLGAPPGPQARAGRIVFDRETLRYLGALTLGELLTHVPGVFLVRAGWFGQPEVVAYAGQGATSLEIVWDGYALDPMGEDSAGFDVDRFSLGLLRRVEVEVLPTVLRAYLFSDGQPVQRPRTETSFATGDAATNTYQIRYLNRWDSGTGLGLGVNWFGTNGPATTPGSVSRLTVWTKGTWMPTPQAGVEYQLIRYSLKRERLDLDGNPALPGGDVRRSDAFLRAFVATGSDGMGLRFDALVGGSSYGDTSGTLEREIHQAAAFASYRAPRWSAEGVMRVRDARTPFEIQVRAAFSPLSVATLSGYALRRSHQPDRRSVEAGAILELRPLRFAVLRGAVRMRDAVAEPAVRADTAQQVTDWATGMALASRRLSIDVGIERHNGYAAPPYGTFAILLPANPSIDVTTLSAHFALRPTVYLTLSGWYRHPLDPLTSAFEPPDHSRLWLTLRSRVLRSFRRGAFDVAAEVGMEAWSDGVAGLDRNGVEIPLNGRTVFDWQVEVRLLGAVIYYTLRNAQFAQYSLVPGIPIARGLSRYGVRWEFTN